MCLNELYGANRAAWQHKMVRGPFCTEKHHRLLSPWTVWQLCGTLITNIAFELPHIFSGCQ